MKRVTSHYQLVLLMAFISSLLLVQPASAQSKKKQKGRAEPVAQESDGFQDPTFQPDFSGAGVYEYKDAPPIKAAVKREKKTPFTGYTKQKPYFYNLCMQLYLDGRSQKVSKLAEKHKGGVVGCPACKAFFRLFFSQCKKVPQEFTMLEKKISTEERRLKTIKARKKKNKEQGIEEEIVEEKEPEEGEVDENGEPVKKRETLEEMRARLPKKQLEPRASVLDAVVRFSQMLFEDTTRMRAHYQALLLLEEGFLSPEGKTKGEKHYFDVLNAYMKAPFSRFEKAKLAVDAIKDREEEQRRREFMLDSNQLFSDADDIFGEN